MADSLPVATVGEQSVSVSDLPEKFIDAIISEMARPLSPDAVSADGAIRMIAQVTDLHTRLATQIISETRKAGRSTVEGSDVDRAVDAITGVLSARSQNYITFSVASGGFAITWLLAIVTSSALTSDALHSVLSGALLLVLIVATIVFLILSKRAVR